MKFLRFVSLLMLLCSLPLSVMAVNPTRDELPVRVFPLTAGDDPIPDTAFSYDFVFASDAACTPVASYSASITTDKNGFGESVINISSLSTIPSHLCTYRDAVLEDVQPVHESLVTGVSGLESSDVTSLGFSTTSSLTSFFDTRYTGINDTFNVSAGDGIDVTGSTVSIDASACGIGEYSYWDGDSWECRSDGFRDIGNSIIPVTGTDYFVLNALYVDNILSRVGIGTQTPSGELHVAGSALVDDSLSVNGSSVLTIATTGSYDVNSSDDVLLTTVHGGDVSGLYDDLELVSSVVGDAEINYSEVTLNDFIDDIGFSSNVSLFSSQITSLQGANSSLSSRVDDLNASLINEIVFSFNNYSVINSRIDSVNASLQVVDTNETVRVDELFVDVAFLNSTLGSLNNFSGSWIDLSSVPAGFVDGFDNDTKYNNLSEFVNDVGYLTSFTEADPSFVSWGFDYANLTGAVPTDLANFTNTPGYLTSFTETDPLYTLDSGSIARIGSCPAGLVVMNTTTSGVECVAMAVDTDTNETARVDDLISQVNSINNFSGSYDDLSGSVPTDLANFTNAPGYLTSFTEVDPLYASDNNSIARVGSCSSGEYVVNTTLVGVDCAVLPMDTDTNETVRVDQLFVNVSSLEISLSSLVNFSGSWSDLSSVPAGFVDGTDNDTIYTESDPYLTLSGTVFGVDETALNNTITTILSTFMDTNETARVDDLVIENATLHSRVDTLNSTKLENGTAANFTDLDVTGELVVADRIIFGEGSDELSLRYSGGGTDTLQIQDEGGNFLWGTSKTPSTVQTTSVGTTSIARQYNGTALQIFTLLGTTGDLFSVFNASFSENFEITESGVTNYNGEEIWNEVSSIPYQVIDGAGGQAITGTEITVNLDTVDIANTAYTLATDTITFNEAGTYHICYRVGLENLDTTGGAQSHIEASIQEDVGAGFVDIQLAYTEQVVRENANQMNVVGDCFLRTYAATDDIRLRSIRNQGTTNTQTSSAMPSKITITRVAA